MDYLTEWAKGLLTQYGGTLRETFQARGECRIYTGAMLWYAAVTIQLSPSEVFQVEELLDSQLTSRLKSEGWYDEIIYGVLDVMLTQPITPIRRFKLSLLGVEIDEIESRGRAFRIAARHAARQVLDLGQLVPGS